MDKKSYQIVGIIFLLFGSLIFLGQSCQRCTDSDGDGYAVEGGRCGEIDCDDTNAGVNPVADEVCDDGVDNNCGGGIDEEGCYVYEYKDMWPKSPWYFSEPEGIDIDSDGNVYVGDSHNRRIQKFASDGTFITKWGSGGDGDGHNG